MSELEKSIIYDFDDYDKTFLKSFTLGQLMQAFYMGLSLNHKELDKYLEEDEVINEFNLTRAEVKVWKNMYYSTNGWFNKED